MVGNRRGYHLFFPLFPHLLQLLDQPEGNRYLCKEWRKWPHPWPRPPPLDAQGESVEYSLAPGYSAWRTGEDNATKERGEPQTAPLLTQWDPCTGGLPAPPYQWHWMSILRTTESLLEPQWLTSHWVWTNMLSTRYSNGFQNVNKEGNKRESTKYCKGYGLFKAKTIHF